MFTEATAGQVHAFRARATGRLATVLEASAGRHAPAVASSRSPAGLHGTAWLYEDTTANQWCTLLNLPSHPGMSFGDGGSLAILIRHKDLAAGRYDRLATDQSMG